MSHTRTENQQPITGVADVRTLLKPLYLSQLSERSRILLPIARFGGSITNPVEIEIVSISA